MYSKFRRVACALFAAGCLSAPLPSQAKFVSLGHVDLSFYEVTASVIQQVMERIGYNVGIKKGSHSEIYPMLADGEVDLFVAAWLPHAHAKYWEEHKDKTVKVTVLYEDARLFWSVPDYVPVSEVSTVADLLKPDVAQKMQKVIRGTRPDSGLMMGSQKIFEAYGLAASGYELAPGKPADWISYFNDNIAAQRWFVMPLWQPQYLNRVHKMRVLQEPKKIFGGPDTAWLVAHKDLKEKIGKLAWGVLERISFSIKQVTELDYAVNVRGVSPRDAARHFLASHPDTVGYWVGGVLNE